MVRKAHIYPWKYGQDALYTYDETGNDEVCEFVWSVVDVESGFPHPKEELARRQQAVLDAYNQQKPWPTDFGYVPGETPNWN